MHLSNRTISLEASATLEITSLTKSLIKQGEDVVNLAAGEPDFDTPDFIKEAAVRAIDEGFTRYTASVGIEELRQAVSNFYQRDKVDYSPREIIITSGAKYACFCALASILNPGDEALIISPYWVSYPQMIKLCGAKPVIAAAKKENGFKARPPDLAGKITSKTKVAIINYPTNPTGITYSKGELEEIFSALVDKNKDIYILSDEIYEQLIYEGVSHTHFASLESAREKTITVSGFSKSFAMTGWRIGYLAGPEEFILQAKKIIDHTTSCASSISQKAALAALNYQGNWQKDMVEKFRRRRDVLFSGLKEIPILDVIKPQGAFYMFCDIGNSGLTAAEFAKRLLQEELVSTIPSEGFGVEKMLRLSFAASISDIEKGIARIKRFCRKF